MDEMDRIFGADSGLDPASVANSSSSAPYVADGEGADVFVQTAPMSSLASFVMSNFRTNADYRRQSKVDEKLKYSLAAYCGDYTDEQKTKLEHMGIDPRMFSPVTFAKTRAAKSMLAELVSSADGPLFNISATPDPDVPEEIVAEAAMAPMREVQLAIENAAMSGATEMTPEAMENARKAVEAAAEAAYDVGRERADEWARTRAKRMLKKVWDKFLEGGWADAFAKYIDDICVYGTGVIVGPVERVCASNVTRRGKDGIRKVDREYRKKLVFEHVCPQDVYPSPDAEDIEDGTLCIRVKYTAPALWTYAQANNGEGSKNGDGWNYNAVNTILRRHPEGGVKLFEERVTAERKESEMKSQDDWHDCTFEGVRCFASVRGSMLFGLGITKDGNGRSVSLTGYYRVEAVVIDNFVVYCKVYDERMGVPVSRGKFYEVPGSWWGDSIASKLFMCQYVQNNAVKSLVRNMTVASGPMFWVDDVQRMVNKGPDALALKPLKMFAFGQSMMGNKGAPMGVLSVPSNASELLSVFDKFRTQADLDSGVPAFTEGQGVGAGAALRTSSGLAIFTESANRGMKCTMHTTDHLVVCRCARMTADWILINDDDQDVKGDVEVVATGLIGRIMKAQRDQLRQQLLSMVLNSQYLQEKLGARAIMVLLRPSVEDVDINADDVVPNEARLREIETLDAIRQLFAATDPNAMQAAMQGQEQQEPGGAPPGVAQPPMPEQPGGVAERRGVA